MRAQRAAAPASPSPAPAPAPGVVSAEAPESLTRALVSSAVLCVSLLLQSHVQERLNREASFRAHSSAVLSLCVPLGALLAGAARSSCGGGARRAARRAPLRAHAVLGLLLWGSFLLSAVGPLHMPMPIFLAAKSVKILPTMVIAALWLRKRFRAVDWAAAALSALGLVLCLTGGSGGDTARGSVAAALRRDGAPSAFGVAVMVGALACDGGAANAQEAIMAHFGAPAAELAAYTYGFATAASVAHGLARGSLLGGARALAREPRVAAAVGAYALASLGATAATLDLIARLGASTSMFVSSLAKAAVILSSVLLSAHFQTSRKQAAGIALVFASAGFAVLARTGGGAWAAAAAAAADARAPAAARAGVEAEATPSAARVDVGARAAGLRRRAAREAAAPPAPPLTPVRAPRSPPAGAADVAAAVAAARGSPIAALRVLRSESSRALSALTAAVFGVERPPARAEALTPSLPSRARGLSQSSVG